MYTVSTSTGTFGTATLIAGGGTANNFANLISATSTTVATNVYLANPYGITGNTTGNNIYFTDYGVYASGNNYACFIWKYNSVSGVISMVAGDTDS